jgi:hypothetical protein
VSYTINIQGHKDGLGTDANASRDFEDGVAAKAKEFVGTLEGVTGATFQGGNIGTRNLLDKAEAAAPQAGQQAGREREFRGSREGEAGTRSAEERQREGEPDVSEADAKRKDLR